MLVFVLFVLSVVIEVFLPAINKQCKNQKLLMVIVGVGSLIIANALLLRHSLNTATLMITVVTAYRLISYFRIYAGRMHLSYIRNISLRTTAVLAGIQAELWLLLLLWRQYHPELPVILSVLAVIQFLIALSFYWCLQRHIKHSKQPITRQAYSTSELPSVTIAVAARNETDELIACLESLIASNYPKLEILVLDDCSQNRRTSEIIRSYAQRGVRFIPGGEPDSYWLARNYAYHKLAQAASGRYTLYCSTSIRLSADSIMKMVIYMLDNKKDMLSVLPGYSLAPGQNGNLEAMRTAWELMPPRKYIGRPPVITSSWMVRTSALKKLGGFAAVSRMIIPETHFATVYADKDAYSFLPGNEYFGIRSAKDLSEQRKTAIRTYYPALHRRPENVLFFTALIAESCMVPLILIFALLFGAKFILISIISVITSIILLSAYYQLYRLMYGVRKCTSILSFGPALLWQLILLHYSMYKYEFSEVIWKDRNVCIPVMHVIPHLPKY